MDEIDRLLERQDGVIARRQALAAGTSASDIRRRLRRRDWVVVHPGVYVAHTGPPSWRQRAWAAVLVHWPAALSGWSAIRAHEGPGRSRHRDDGVIEVIVDHGRTLTQVPGVRARRVRRFADIAQMNLGPPRLRYDDAVLELADRATSPVDAIAVLADACGGRRTTAQRLRQRMDATPRLHRRRWLCRILDDIGEGTCSVLEHRYLTHVERAHGLPRSDRQVAGRSSSGRRLFRDVTYRGTGWTVHVELDGRLGHDTTEDRDRDFERDLDAAVDGHETVRIGYGQVFTRPCLTARRIGTLLNRSGWRGATGSCPTCSPGQSGVGGNGASG